MLLFSLNNILLSYNSICFFAIIIVLSTNCKSWFNLMGRKISRYQQSSVEMLTCHARCIPDKRIRFSTYRMHAIDSYVRVRSTWASKACKAVESTAFIQGRISGKSAGAAWCESAGLCSENDTVYIQSLSSLSCLFRVKEHASAYFDYKVSSPASAVVAAATATLRDTSQEFDPLKAGVARLSLEMIRVVFCPTSDRDWLSRYRRGL